MQAVEEPGIGGFNMVPSKLHVTSQHTTLTSPLPLQWLSIILGTKSSEAILLDSPSFLSSHP